MAMFPKIDIDPEFAAEASLHAQNASELEVMHAVAEDNVYPYSAMHKAVELTATVALENSKLEQGIMAGVLAFEAIAGAYPEINTYESIAARALALSAPLLFADRIRSTDDFLERLDYARDRMLVDTPVLAEAVTDVSSRLVWNDEIGKKFALGAAGMMRGMQIFIDNRIAALETLD